jgi:hypothetical protein
MLCAHATASAQEYIPLLAQKHIGHFLALEHDRGSEPFTPSAWQRTELSPPVSFVRTDAGARPRPVISYQYTRHDSIVRRISLQMDSLLFLPETGAARKNYREPDERREAFINEYEKLVDELTQELGAPEHSTPLHRYPEKAQGGSWRRNDTWQSDPMKVDLFLVFSDNTTTEGEYRIRLYINWDYEKPVPPAARQATTGFEGTPEQRQVSEEFLALLEDLRFEDGWELLEEELRQRMDYATFAERMGSMRKIAMDPMELHRVSMEKDLTGVLRPVYTYAVIPAGRRPPERMIRISFADTESTAISGVVPRDLSTVRLVPMRSID